MKYYATHRKSRVLLAFLLILIGRGMLLVETSASPQPVEAHHKVVPVIAVKEHSMKLIGTVVGINRHDSVVIVVDERKGHQWSLREGDQVGTIVIKHIQSDRVVINTSKGIFEVKMQRNIFTEQTQSAAASHFSSNSSKSVKAGPRSRVYRLDQNVVKTAYADIGAAMDSIAANPGRLFNQDRGVRVSSIEQDSVFADMGLRRGDLILRVNNVEVAGVNDLKTLIRNLQAEGEAGFTVRRRARTYNFSLQTH